MDTALAPSAFSTSHQGWPLPSQAPLRLPEEGTSTPWAFPEPPALGTLPKGTRKQALALSIGVYGGLLGGVLGLSLTHPALSAPKRTVAVALDAFDSIPAPPPPPPPGPSGGASKASEPSQSETPSQVRPSEEVRPALEASLPSATPQTPGPGGGAAGGQPGGVAGGVAGGQLGGTVGGQVGGVVLPRFDAAYLQNPEPEYPSLSKRLGEEGRVILRVLVTPEGLADQVEIRQSSGHARLDQAALGTVRHWRFTPARRGQERLAAWVLVPLSFLLDA